MQETKPARIKNITFVLIMLFFVGIIATSTYFVVYYNFRPTQLPAPTNLTLLEGNLLTWDVVEGADSYTVHISSGTTLDTTIYVYQTMYTVNEYNKVVFDISSELDPDKNYSIAVKANSDTLENSGYCEEYELIQIEE